MNVQPSTGQPAQNSILAFYDQHRQAFRVGIHITLWLITIALANYTIPVATKGYTFATNILVLTTIIQTMAYYYVMGYIILPRYLYSFQPLKLILWSAFVFFLVHLSNYYTFAYLHQLGDDLSLPTDSYVETNWRRFREAGILGGFTNLRVFLLNIVYSTNVSLLYLLPKVCKDLVTIRTKSLRLERNNLRLERNNLNLELDFLKAQVNPHFLFNTLNSVYARVFDSDEQAADLVLRLSELMRYNLYETDVAKISLDKELGYVQNYLDLERNRLSDQYVVIDYEQSGTSSAYQIAPLLLITFVENAFKHGVKGTTEPAYVQVSATLTADQLVFRVENSVPFRREVAIAEPSAESAKKSGGIGLGNVSRRLDALYKGRYELVVTPAETIYTVVLTMQLEAVSAVVNARV